MIKEEKYSEVFEGMCILIFSGTSRQLSPAVRNIHVTLQINSLRGSCLPLWRQNGVSREPPLHYRFSFSPSQCLSPRCSWHLGYDGGIGSMSFLADEGQPGTYWVHCWLRLSIFYFKECGTRYQLSVRNV